MSRLIKGVTGTFGTESKAMEIESFFKNDVPEILSAAPRAVKQSLEAIRIRSKWSERDLIKITTFLDKI